jgi:hypothetical protein
MSTSAVQHTVQIRPSRLAGLLVAVAVLTAATTWSASKLDESHSSATADPAAKAYVDSVMALTAGQRAAVYGNVMVSDQHVNDIVALSPGERAAVYGNVMVSDQHVNDIVALSPGERAAIYGNLPMSVGTP